VNGIIAVYDIFGFFPQTQQGADMIASSLQTRVYMPDFFEPDQPFPPEKMPPTCEQDKVDLQAFFGSIARPGVAIGKLKRFGQLLRDEGKEKIGAYGLCWGGKVVMRAGDEQSPLDAVSILHPAMLSVEDAHKLTVPLAIYISKDEPVDEYDKIVSVISKKPFAGGNDAKHYTNMHHGWAGARANLENEENLKEFEDVYKRLVIFFEKNLFGQIVSSL